MYFKISKLKSTDRYNIHRDVMRLFPDNFDGRVLFRVSNGFVIVISSFRFSGSYLLTLDSGVYQYSIEANPTVKRNGKRYPLFGYDNLSLWFMRKFGGSVNEFSIKKIQQLSPVKVYYGVFNRVVFSGTVNIVDTVSMESSIVSGVGSAKGFGFGLIVLDRWLLDGKQKPKVK